MTYEKILRCKNPEELEALTDAQIAEYFAPVLPTTRPDTGRVTKSPTGAKAKAVSKKASQQQILAEAMMLLSAAKKESKPQ